MPPQFGQKLKRSHRKNIAHSLQGKGKTEQHCVGIMLAKLARHGVTIEQVITARAAGHRWCTRHKLFLDAALFGKSGTHCRSCRREVAFETTHGAPYSWYEEKFKQQNGRCALCKKTPEELGIAVLDLDHDHGCCGPRRSCQKCARGLLCHQCNNLVGAVEKDLQLSRMVLDYISGYGASAVSK